jgi:hypothetical protein
MLSHFLLTEDSELWPSWWFPEPSSGSTFLEALPQGWDPAGAHPWLFLKAQAAFTYNTPGS